MLQEFSHFHPSVVDIMKLVGSELHIIIELTEVEDLQKTLNAGLFSYMIHYQHGYTARSY